MFDDLDDPNPVPAGPGERAAVGARVARIRQRRTAWLAGSASLVLAMVAGTVVALREPPADRVVQSLDTTESPSATYETINPSSDPVIESETPSVAPPTTVAPEPPPTTEPPEPTKEPDPVPPVTVTSSPTVTVTPPGGGPNTRGNEPDGKPGWGGDFAGCTPREAMLPEGGEPAFASVTARIELPETMTTGRGVEGKLVLTNTGSEPVTFDADGPQTAVRNKDTGQMDGRYWTDVHMQYRIELDPGEEYDIDLWIHTETCGDTKEDDEPLPAGEYVFAAMFHWSTRAESGETSRSGYFGVHADGRLS